MSLADEHNVVDGVLKAIAEHRLKAGTKLGEVALGEVYRCSRADVRRALISLAGHKVVELKKNRGAFIAVPLPEEARDVFQARRAIERTLARNAVLNATAVQIAELYAHTDLEQAARKARNRHDAIGLSGQFHMLLGTVGGNEVLQGYLRELIMRSSLIISLYASEQAPLCEDDEHRQIVAAIERHDIDASLLLIDRHLRHIESSLQFERQDAPTDIRKILASGAGASGGVVG